MTKAQVQVVFQLYDKNEIECCLLAAAGAIKVWLKLFCFAFI